MVTCVHFLILVPSLVPSLPNTQIIIAFKMKNCGEKAWMVFSHDTCRNVHHNLVTMSITQTSVDESTVHVFICGSNSNIPAVNLLRAIVMCVCWPWGGGGGGGGREWLAGHLSILLRDHLDLHYVLGISGTQLVSSSSYAEY